MACDDKLETTSLSASHPPITDSTWQVAKALGYMARTSISSSSEYVENEISQALKVGLFLRINRGTKLATENTPIESPHAEETRTTIFYRETDEIDNAQRQRSSLSKPSIVFLRRPPLAHAFLSVSRRLTAVAVVN